MTLHMGFGAALRLARKGKGLTQEDFSEVSSSTYLSTLERGIKSPTLEKIGKLASVLDIHPLSLLALAYSEAAGTDTNKLLKQVASEVESLTR